MSDGEQNTIATGKPKRVKRPTIYDVVRLSGFSRGSVSRAFNNSPFINDATREKIMEVARQIGYQPHAGARLIRSGMTRRWGILLPSFANPYYAMLFEAFDIEARIRGTFLQLGLFHYDASVTEVLVGLWSAGEVDGLIADCGVESPELMSKVIERGIPMIYVHSRPSASFDYVYFDRELPTKYAMETFQRFGHEKVAYVGILGTHTERLALSYRVWLEWFKKYGKGDPENYCCFVSNSGDGGVEAWHQFQARGLRPTAVLAYNDSIACGILQSARSSGLRVPEDLSVVGSDDIEEGRRCGLCTMRPDVRSAATSALKQLEMRRQGDNSGAAAIRIESHFVMRDSIGPAKRTE